MRGSVVADRIGFYLFAACTSLAAVPFGAVEPAAASALGLALAICLFFAALAPAPPDQSLRPLRTAAVLTAFIAVWAGVQAALPHPVAAQPAVEAGRRLLADGAASPLGMRFAVMLSAGYVLIPLAGFLCALVFVRNEEGFVTFAHILIAVNVVIALGCIAQFLVAPQTLLWTDKRHYLESFTGTFVNPNTAATHFGVLLLLALGLCLSQFRPANIGGYFDRDFRSVRESEHLRRFSAYGAAAFVFLVALLLTKSRGGIMAALAGVATLVAIFAYIDLKNRTSTARAILVSGLSVVAILAVFIFFGERLILRIQAQGLVEGGRICAYRATIAAIRDTGWLGSGFGTFQDVFPAYRTADCGLYGHWDMAHNVFLEGWLVAGLAFPICAGLAYYELVRAFGTGIRRRRRYRFAAMSGLGILVLLTLHSLVDFSLQVPGFSLLAAAALGAGTAVSLRSRPAL